MKIAYINQNRKSFFANETFAHSLMNPGIDSDNIIIANFYF